MSLRFKEAKHASEVAICDFRLQLVLYALAGYAAHRWGKHITVTSVIRPEKLTSPHAHRRAIDIRRHDFTDAEVAEMELFVNNAIVYGGKRVVFLDEPNAPGGAHVHLQVPSDPRFMPEIV